MSLFNNSGTSVGQFGLSGQFGQFGQPGQPGQTGQNQFSQQNTSLFSNPSTPGRSLGNAQSQPQGSPSLFNSNNHNSLGPNSYTNQNLNNSSLGHSQSMMNLNAVSSSNSPSRPGWTRSDRRITPNHVSSLRHKSSFSTTTPDRHSSSNGLHRHLSVSGNASISRSNKAGSPPEPRFGHSSSFGTPKPLHARKADVIDESDLPPSDSIYDSGARPFFNSTPSDTPAVVSSSQSSYDLFSQSNSISKEGSTSSKGINGNSTIINTTSNNGNMTGSSSPLKTPSNSNSRRLSSNYLSTTPLPSPVRTITPGPTNSVVIFGFPSNVTNIILNHFSKFGDILENMDTSSTKANSRQDTPLPVRAGKNWLRITYKNPQSAQRALNENGKTLGGQFLIGCVPYTAKGLENGIGSTSLLTAEESFEIDNFNDIDDEAPPQNSIRNTPLIEEEEEQQENFVLEEPKQSTTTSVNVNKKKGFIRTISMPVLASGSKRLEVKDGQSVFTHPKGRGLRFAPSLANIAAAATNPSSNDKKLKSSKQSWLGWTTKRAQEFVFGWDDL